MTKTEDPTIRQNMETNALGCNKYLTKKHLKTLSLISVLRSTHPLDRKDFAQDLRKEGQLSEKQMKLFTQL